MKNILDLLARAMLAFIFLYEAYDYFFYFQDTGEMIDLYGIVWNKTWLLYGAIFILFFGGILLLLGYRVQFAVFLLLIYWIPVTFTVHSFWNDPIDCQLSADCLNGIQSYRRWQSIMFMKNIAIIGGLLMVYINGSGKYSVKRLFATTRVK